MGSNLFKALRLDCILARRRSWRLLPAGAEAIGFVGLLMPHLLARIFVGADPAGFAVGCDAVGGASIGSSPSDILVPTCGAGRDLQARRCDCIGRRAVFLHLIITARGRMGIWHCFHCKTYRFRRGIRRFIPEFDPDASAKARWCGFWLALTAQAKRH